MQRSRLNFIRVAVTTLLFLVSGTNSAFAQLTPSGTEIFNRAEADYFDFQGNRLSTVSQTVSFIVRSVPRLTVSPDETEPTAIVGANERVVRVFRVCNTGNVADTYQIIRSNISSPSVISGLYFDIDDNGIISNADIPIILNQTDSPQTVVSGCFNVLADILTNNMSVGSRLEVEITARSNTSAAVQDIGTIVNIAGRSAIFTSPTNPALPPLKQVNQSTNYVGTIGERVNYSVSFKNSGDVPANNSVFIDNLPNEVRYVPNSLRLDNRNLTDLPNDDEGTVASQKIEIRFAQPIAAGQIVRITFQAIVEGAIPGGQGIINTATVSATNAATATTNPAVIIVNPYGVVYSGTGGGNVVLPNARVAVYLDNQGENLAAFIPNVGFEPNAENLNPFQSNEQGRFTFAPNSQESFSPNMYYLNVTAENYRARLLEVRLTPTADNLFSLQIRALDGMPIAVSGGFDLTPNEVSIERIAALAFNIPMFAASNLEISKSADRSQAEIGENVNYRIDVNNASLALIRDVEIRDTLPFSFNYIAGTGRILRNRVESPIDPQTSENSIIFRVGQLAVGETISITYRVRIGVNARIGDNYNSAVALGYFANGDRVSTEPAKVPVRISGGLFSLRQLIIGRIFADKNGNNSFDKGEKGLPGVRVYLANGSSAITDSEGLYSFPAVTEGSQTISIDPLTIPEGYFLSKSKAKQNKSWTRLLRTPIGGGGMLRQNFALTFDESFAAKKKPAKPEQLEAVYVKPGTEPKKDSAENKTETESPTIAAVAEGDVRIENLADNEVVKSPAMNPEVSVRLSWKVKVELNGENIGETSIGTTRDDRRTQVTTYTFIGLGLKPGPNTLSVTPINPNGTPTAAKKINIFGRGNVKRIEIIPAKKQLQASGRDRTLVKIKAFDEWNNPAQDSAVAVQTTHGSLKKNETVDIEKKSSKEFLDETPLPENSNSPVQQETLNLTNGEAEIELVSGNQIGEASFKVIAGGAEAVEKLRFTAELRPDILVSLGEITFGSNSPEMSLRNTTETARGHLQFFYRGKVFGQRNLLTLAYDSQQPLNRVAGQDRLFQLSPLERTYAILGDSSVRFQEAESNSKLYFRLDRNRHYAVFGDIEADMNASRLAGYSRRLTGVKLHLENNNGDFVTVTGARPDTSFARQVIPGGSLSLVRLDYADILIGSETLNLEVRDRRNPEIILSREPLTRGIDYNIDFTTGTIIFLRPISTFDYALNLIQVVATYEYRSNGLTNQVYTGRASKNFEKLGLRFGFSYIDQRQTEASPFRIAGTDFTLKLPGDGVLEGEFAVSRGLFNNSSTVNNDRINQNGNAFFVALNQPLQKFFKSNLRFDLSGASAGYFNPFGSTITAGNKRANISLETKPFERSLVKLNLIGEKNRTVNVDNTRITAGLLWSQSLTSKFRVNFGYDYRIYTDKLSEKTTNSSLLTIGADWKPTERLDFAVKREQNLSGSDPSFPDQTTFSANYRVNDWAKIFFTQRLAAAEISPIADLGGTGFSSTRSRRETAFGIESKLGKYTSLNSRYQLENGINSSDSFALIGLSNRLPIKKNLSVEFGFERAFHLEGTGKSFNNVSFGLNYTPTDSFRASTRYEMRNRDGFGQSFSIGAAGILKKGWTTLTRFQYGNVAFKGRTNRIMDGQAAFAVRPHDTDKYGLLFSYNYRNSFLSGRPNEAGTKLRADTLSADGFYQINPRLEFYGRSAIKISGDGNQTLPFASTLTYLLQGRLQYRLTSSFDVAAETRYLFQPSSLSKKQSIGTELGYWLTPDLRFGIGYNLRQSKESLSLDSNNTKAGMYFTITSKISRLFNLFGTPKESPKSVPEVEEVIKIAKSTKE
jgi:uncharacterized repeat protein (TIGR01451 family)